MHSSYIVRGRGHLSHPVALPRCFLSIGQSSHVSARYPTQCVHDMSHQSTSGVIVVSDLDWTMVNHHQSPDHTDLKTFNSTWKHIVEKNPDSLLVYSSGRSPVLYEELAGEVPLLQPDILVCSVGTEMMFLKDASKQGIHDAWEEYLNGEGWDREVVQRVVSDMVYDGIDVSLQQESEQRPHKVSYKVRGEDVGRLVDGIRSTLERSHGMRVNVIYSGGEDLDVLPLRASKGKALEFFLEHGHVHDAHVVVCGDSGNDVELFQVPGVHGCIVANAHVELRDWYEAYGKDNDKMFFCTQQGPAGIVECLHHFGFV